MGIWSTIFFFTYYCYYFILFYFLFLLCINLSILVILYSQLLSGIFESGNRVILFVYFFVYVLRKVKCKYTCENIFAVSFSSF